MSDLIQIKVNKDHRLSIGWNAKSVVVRVEQVVPGPGEAWREVVVVGMSRYQARVVSAALRALSEDGEETEGLSEPHDERRC